MSRTSNQGIGRVIYMDTEVPENGPVLGWGKDYRPKSYTGGNKRPGLGIPLSLQGEQEEA